MQLHATDVVCIFTLTLIDNQVPPHPQPQPLELTDWSYLTASRRCRPTRRTPGFPYRAPQLAWRCATARPWHQTRGASVARTVIGLQPRRLINFHSNLIQIVFVMRQQFVSIIGGFRGAPLAHLLQSRDPASWLVHCATWPAPWGEIHHLPAFRPLHLTFFPSFFLVPSANGQITL